MNNPERRKYLREIKTGSVTLSKVGTHSQINVRCNNISIAGMCIEIELKERIMAGESYELTVALSEREAPIHMIGRVIWVRLVKAGAEGAPPLYHAGIRFKE
jgi:hypothetical protein